MNRKLLKKPTVIKGHCIAKENSNDLRGEIPNQQPAANVAPRREIPGNNEMPCTAPSSIALEKVTEPLFPVEQNNNENNATAEITNPTPTKKSVLLKNVLHNKKKKKVTTSAAKTNTKSFNKIFQQRLTCNSKKNQRSKKNNATTIIVGPCKKCEITLLEAKEKQASFFIRKNIFSSNATCPELLTGKTSKTT